MDMLVVLFVLVAAWAFIVAAERGNLGLLLLGAIVIGLGFNVKTLQAFLVLPAFYLLYLLAARTTWRRRFLHLGLATAVLLAVSLSWAIAVDLTPTEQRPYVGGSENDSALNLAFGYNGLERLLGREGPPGGPPGGSKGGGPGAGKAAEQSPAPSADSKGDPKAGPGGGPRGGGPGGVGENGEPGPFRLLNQQNAGQIGWLLPLAVVGLLATSWQRGRPRLPLDGRQGALVMWGTWFFVAAAYFSVSGYGHRHYLVMLAPAIAALVGIGATALWRDYRELGWRGWLLPLALVGMAAAQAYILWDYDGWPLWLTPAISGLCLVTVGVLTIARLRFGPNTRASSYLVGVATMGVLALLVAPAAWAAHATLLQDVGGPLPAAGPRPVEAGVGGPGRPAGSPGGGPPPGGGPGGPGREADPVLLEYLQANKGDATYLVAGPDFRSMSSIILGTDEPVINLGGFMGRDPVFTADDLADLVDEGAVRFFLMPDRALIEEMRATREAEREASGDAPPQGGPGDGPGGGFGPGGGLPQNVSAEWIEDNCEKVPPELWQPPENEERGGGGPPGRTRALYNCGAGGS